jgi:hypothetical protein
VPSSRRSNRREHAPQTPERSSPSPRIVPSNGAEPLPAQWPISGIVIVPCTRRAPAINPQASVSDLFKVPPKDALRQIFLARRFGHLRPRARPRKPRAAHASHARPPSAAKRATTAEVATTPLVCSLGSWGTPRSRIPCRLGSLRAVLATLSRSAEPQLRMTDRSGGVGKLRRQGRPCALGSPEARPGVARGRPKRASIRLIRSHMSRVKTAS